ncbi:hypothetical protein GCM10010497_59360 [Streptomyces cinereoruber]|uniref:Transmembrane protein n=1 Tax=Streptomyces cinereoruber TaxID=67260 RepID=A0AAV4KT73_9ACTN|nr:hypothetical protein [Streptomyces cinereoruber]MBB4161717.1 hypothetical protein [Streptomyces cinereoruber]MBY8820036.1 hypothetical protein [Streptomyces cinereoruber]NIH65402.1 hypothetical protein [Streptomyces cinereoruber]GGR48116.1 hypothetical protein GCM10010497_59360 [Streptomyces cinereoruber]
MPFIPALGRTKPARGGRFRVSDTSRRDENTQRHDRLVHTGFIAIPATPIVVIAIPNWNPWDAWQSWIASAVLTGLMVISRLVWNFATQRHLTV